MLCCSVQSQAKCDKLSSMLQSCTQDFDETFPDAELFSHWYVLSYYIDKVISQIDYL